MRSAGRKFSGCCLASLLDRLHKFQQVGVDFILVSGCEAMGPARIINLISLADLNAATGEAAHTSSQQLKPGATQGTKRPSTSSSLSFFLDCSALVDSRRDPKYQQFVERKYEWVERVHGVTDGRTG
jgi:hypothetical protein